MRGRGQSDMDNRYVIKPTIPVSVVIPAYNEEGQITELLESLLVEGSALPQEVIVVDAHSSDSTSVKVIEWRKVHPQYNIRLLRSNTQTFPGKGRNLGIRKAQADLIAFIDCGIIPLPDWLEELCAPLIKDPSIDVAWGIVKPYAGSTRERVFAFLVEPPGTQPRRFIPSICIRRDVLQKVGLFREDLRAAEDILFRRLIKHHNLTETFTPARSFYTGYPKGTRAILKKWTKYSESEVKANVHQRKLLLIAGQLLVFLSLWLYLSRYAGYLLSALITGLVLNLAMIGLKKEKIEYKVCGLHENLLAFYILFLINTGRIIGILRGVVLSFLRQGRPTA